MGPGAKALKILTRITWVIVAITGSTLIGAVCGFKRVGMIGAIPLGLIGLGVGMVIAVLPPKKAVQALVILLSFLS